ncbi:MAG: hypothetical protein HQM11_18985 [SAR324 cluster bacterium]|nr:hypothetical protein [SAR324 cluster bacterium]
MENQPNSFLNTLFSTKGLIIIALCLAGYWIFFGGDKEKKQLAYDSDSPPIGISDNFSQEALDKLGVDLTQHLDPKLVPAMVADALKETSEAGVGEEEFVKVFISNLSNKIKNVSTIDLNEDGLADPVLIIPQDSSEGGDFLQLSIRVPDPSEVTSYPPSSDQDAWRDIVENKSIEIMTASAVKEDDNTMNAQAAANPQVYTGAPPYYHHHVGFGQILLTSMVMHSLFTPRFYGPSFYGGFSPPVPVTTVQSNRSAVTSSTTPAQASNTAAKTSTGKSVSSNNFKQVPPKSLNQIKSTQFKAQNPGRTAGGFGKPSTPAAPKPSQVAPAPAPKRQGFGSSNKSSFGGSKKSFGGFGKRRR